MLWAEKTKNKTKKTLEQRGSHVCWVQGKRNVLWKEEVKSFLEYNGKEAIIKEDKGTMSHRKLESGVDHT